MNLPNVGDVHVHWGGNPWRVERIEEGSTHENTIIHLTCVGGFDYGRGVRLGTIAWNLREFRYDFGPAIAREPA
jgi:hypothetical protein